MGADQSPRSSRRRKPKPGLLSATAPGRHSASHRRLRHRRQVAEVILSSQSARRHRQEHLTKTCGGTRLERLTPGLKVRVAGAWVSVVDPRVSPWARAGCAVRLRANQLVEARTLVRRSVRAGSSASAPSRRETQAWRAATFPCSQQAGCSPRHGWEAAQQQLLDTCAATKRGQTRARPRSHRLKPRRAQAGVSGRGRRCA